MDAIGTAVLRGREGDTGSARRDLLDIWFEIGAAGDPFHRCTLAHYLADLHESPAESLIWDVRALDAADALSDERAQRYHAGLRVAGFYPSLHLNIADDLRRLGAFGAAAEHLDRAEPEPVRGTTVAAEALMRDTGRRATFADIETGVCDVP